MGGRFSTRCSSAAVWAAHETRAGGDGQQFWEDIQGFIYVGDHSAGDPRSLSESGPHGSRRDQFEDPDSSEVCKPSKGGGDVTPRVSVYNRTHLSQRASNRRGNRIEII